MLSCRDARDRLDERVDRAPGPAGADEVERHLAVCAACRREIEGLRNLRRVTAELPRRIEPARDLLPGIRAAALRRDAAMETRPVRWSPIVWAGAGLAASILFLVWLVPPRGGQAPRPSPATIAERDPRAMASLPAPAGAAGMTRHVSWMPLDEMAAAEADYTRATAALMALLDERRDHLGPEARAVVDANLAIIDRAIAQIQKAMEESPGDPSHGRTLNAMYRHKLDVLWRVSRLSHS